MLDGELECDLDNVFLTFMRIIHPPFTLPAIVGCSNFTLGNSTPAAVSLLLP